MFACGRSCMINAPIRMFICVRIREWKMCVSVVCMMYECVCVCVVYKCIVMLASSPALLHVKVNETERKQEEQ